MQLSKKRKASDQLFSAFLKFRLNLERFQEKVEPHC